MSDLPDDGVPMELTAHARVRVDERCVDPDALALLLRHADLRRQGRDGCARVRLSRRAAKRLDRDRVCPRQTIEGARELEAVVAPGATCVTTWRLPADSRFRRTGARPSRTRVRRMAED